MKAMILTAASLICASHSGAASACSQATPLVSQNGALQTVLASDSYKNAIRKFSGNFGVSITNIEITDGVAVYLSNGCVVSSWIETTPPTHPGMCPRFKGVRTDLNCIARQ